MTLRDYVVSLRKNWIVIVALAVLGAIGGYAYGQTQPDLYRSQSSVMVIPARGDNTSELVQGSNYVQNLVQTYAVVATSPTVLDPVIRSLGLNTSAQALASTISVESPLNTVVLNISVVARDAVTAQQIADAVATELSNEVQDLSPQNADNKPAVRVQTITPAKVAASPFAPNVRLFVLVGAGIGLAIGILYAVLRRLLATRLVSRADVTALTETPLLGEVYQAGTGVSLAAAVRSAPRSSVTESVRNIVANLRFANLNGVAQVILVTSATSGEGKSSVSVAMSEILAEQGARVLLIDADLRRASIAELTGLEGAVGLTTALLGDVSVADSVQEWQPHLDVLTSGALPPNPVQLLTSAQLRSLLVWAREHYDYVIIDSAPVLAVSDPLWLAPNADGIVVVARSRMTKRDALARTLSTLEATRESILGIVLNGAKTTDLGPYYEVQPEKRGRRSAAPRESTA
ncbi:polysaccharide biosynthesis tyrosine autokinase [Microbacterium sp. VKM Ac-2870]|uniref:polysaccharide biosynthesis tyrosine autokinase n=1 Tax=Microbacterium sp. VKM Ac-2870 TaxID=2783825 RepID=UPI00188C5161|nr:polysaccharide biosynthesis tyrosine autokinase [Microbacterium sp. VKM Ac-2870]MBF4562785.1 polysaccharide biosynthesis tyrosine autokinase [Microbacterium sp. VKM Ac-2870]